MAEHLSVGPSLAAWLASASAADVQDGALAGVAMAWRRLASWAQAGELAAVAQIASRAAGTDGKIAVSHDGRPAGIAASAAAEVALGLNTSQNGACWWTDLAITLTWRLKATGAALAAGRIDLARARLIAEATALLDDDTARLVEARVLAGAGALTTGQLRAALRRSVIATDPEGAERRREAAERKAKVCLYPDDEGTASLSGYNLPGVQAASAMARIGALARALRAAGADGGIDLLRAQVYLGLLLGTLPCIPPAEAGPPDDLLPSDPGPGAGPDNGPGRKPGPDDGPGREPEPEYEPRGELAADDEPGREPGPDDGPEPEYEPRGEPAADDGPGREPGSGRDRDGRTWPRWPDLPAVLAGAPASLWNVRPLAGDGLSLTVLWGTLAGTSAPPGQLSRLGPITSAQARRLGYAAAMSGTAQWRVIITDREGHVLAVTRTITARAGPSRAADARIDGTVPSRAGPAPESSAPDHLPGPVSRVTVVVPREVVGSDSFADSLAVTASRQRIGTAFDRTLAAIRSSAILAAREADRVAAEDAAAGECSHHLAGRAYQPSPRLRELIAARDQTCRFPVCRQPAWRCDLDHTRAYAAGGRTCRCNLGGLCRAHHRLKQHPRWQLAQLTPGAFAWTTETGRTYSVGPDSYLP